MEKYQQFFLDYLDFLQYNYKKDGNLVIAQWSQNDQSYEARYALKEADLKEGTIGFYPGTNFFYQILDSCLTKGAFTTAYVKKVPDPKTQNQTREGFIPYLYLWLQLISPQPKAPRLHFSLLINLITGTVSQAKLENYLATDPGPVVKKKISYKEALNLALDHIQANIELDAEWLRESKQQLTNFKQALAKAGLSPEENEQTILATKARLFPNFQVQIKLLGRLFILEPESDYLPIICE